MTIEPTETLRERHANLTREAILRSVAEMLQEGAVEEISVPDVARRAGVSLRTVYRHFPTRDELLAGAGEWIGENLLTARIPTAVDEIARDYEDSAVRFDQLPNLVRAMAVTRAGNSIRSVRRRRRLDSLREALAEVTDRLPEHEARRAFAVLAYLDNMLAWVTMRDEAGLGDGEVGAAVGWAMRTLIDDLRRRNEAAGAARRGASKRRSNG